MQLVFASSNKNKIREMNAILDGRHTVIGLEEIGIFEEIPETGTTIGENSFLKADYVRNFLKGSPHSLAVFSDDSGLEVEALNNSPGVYSARYAGIPKNDVANNTKLLEELSSASNRNARFVTVITLIVNGNVQSFRGEIRGTIAHQAAGNNGFGYDPLFIPLGYTSTFAQLDSVVKNGISHRAAAMEKLLVFLNSLP